VIVVFNNLVATCVLINELGIASSFGNFTLLTKGDSRLDKSVLCSFGIATKNAELVLLSLYWVPKLHKSPHKQLYIAGSTKAFMIKK
jgi:hypothetical protein